MPSRRQESLESDLFNPWPVKQANIVVCAQFSAAEKVIRAWLLLLSESTRDVNILDNPDLHKSI